MNQDFRAALRAFIAELAHGAPFSDDEDLVRGGIVSSLHMIELITFLGDRFGVVVSEADIHHGRLTSVTTMAALVEEFS